MAWVFGVVVAASTAMGSFRQLPSAPVQITNVVGMSGGPLGGPPLRPIRMSWECVSFRNAASKAIAHVEFVLWRETPQGVLADEPEALGMNATVAPGALVDASPPGTSCRTTLESGNLVAQVRTVQFSDHTSWNAPGYSDNRAYVPESFEPAPQALGVTVTGAHLGSGACVDYNAAGVRAYSDLFFASELTNLAGQFLGDNLAAYTPGTTCLGKGEYGGSFMTIADFGLSGIRYADGSIWSAVPPIPGSVRNVPASGVELSSVATYAGVTPQLAANSEHRGLDTCATATNVSSLAITHVQIVFAHVDPSNRMIEQDPFDVRQTLAPGASLTALCRTFDGAIYPSMIAYIRAAATGAPAPPPPGVYYQGTGVSLYARITRVDFAGGKTWTME